MTNWGLIVGLIVGIQYAGYGYYYVYTHYIRPFLYYKINVFDINDEFVFYIKKKKCISVKDNKVFTLFKDKKTGKGELYNIPMKTKKNEVFSKRDNLGHVTYYYFRNCSNPISIVKNKDLQMHENSSALYDLLETKIFNASLMLDNKMPKIDFMLLGIIGLIITLIVIFKDDILKALGV